MIKGIEHRTNYWSEYSRIIFTVKLELCYVTLTFVAANVKQRIASHIFFIQFVNKLILINRVENILLASL